MLSGASDLVELVLVVVPVAEEVKAAPRSKVKWYRSPDVVSMARDEHFEVRRQMKSSRLLAKNDSEPISEVSTSELLVQDNQLDHEELKKIVAEGVAALQQEDDACFASFNVDAHVDEILARAQAFQYSLDFDLPVNGGVSSSACGAPPIAESTSPCNFYTTAKKRKQRHPVN